MALKACSVNKTADEIFQKYFRVFRSQQIIFDISFQMPGYNENFRSRCCQNFSVNFFDDSGIYEVFAFSKLKEITVNPRNTIEKLYKCLKYKT